MRSSLARSGPSPAMTSRASTPASHNAASASMLRSACFSTDSRPQWTSRICVGVAQCCRTRAQRRRGWKVFRSTPSGTVTVFVAPMRSNSSRANPVVHTTVS
ncbi:Uncharacterised protein [Mycobacterium tuberculosis]|nr:Uncharacterised protein [Mycobacterium tuberculosis]